VADEAPGTHAAQILFSIEDTGKGIHAADLDRIFQPFGQLDGSTTRQHGGVGLGLAVCKRLARLMGGDVIATSEYGRGSRFTLLLPLRPAHSHAGTSMPPPAEALVSTPDGAPVDWPEIHRLFERLRPLVAEDDIQALTLWNSAFDSMHRALGASAAQIGSELEAYDFEAALKSIDQSLARLPDSARANDR
jgi:hypothetical protein